MIVHRGGCHCGRVRFEVEGPEDIEARECNCSICGRSGYLHLIVSRTRFRLIDGEAELTSYRFNTRTANHLFCRTCGVKAFYVPRSHPEGISVNTRCIDAATVRTLRVQPFDGVNWERNAGDLGPLSN